MGIFRCKAAALALVGCGATVAANRFEIEWRKVQEETLEHYSRLLRIDTTNPPGNETKGASYVKSVLDREGVPAQLIALDPDRANLVARLKGNGSKKPILIMGHTDTVGVQREKWSVDPFDAIRKDGFVYGRGAQDDKDNLTAGLMLMLLLKRVNLPLDRDVIAAHPFLEDERAGTDGLAAEIGASILYRGGRFHEALALAEHAE